MIRCEMSTGLTTMTTEVGMVAKLMSLLGGMETRELHLDNSQLHDGYMT